MGVDQLAQHAAIDHLVLSGGGLDQPRFAAAVLVEDRDDEGVAVPADEVGGAVGVGDDLVRLRVGRVGRDDPHLRVLAAVRVDLAGQPGTVVGVAHCDDGAIDGQLDRARLRHLEPVRPLQVPLHGVRVAAVVDDVRDVRARR